MGHREIAQEEIILETQWNNAVHLAKIKQLLEKIPISDSAFPVSFDGYQKGNRRFGAELA